ncbi:MAG: helix-turn-helix transcriptional regulator [Clostridia bacterium]|nr:helix-turn-helix transcriptional regulator [Clostridia bacterium]
MIFNERLKEQRVEKGLKQSDVAKQLGISVSCYAGYEQGYREPDLKTLIAICKFFSVSSDYLLGLED